MLLFSIVLSAPALLPPAAARGQAEERGILWTRESYGLPLGDDEKEARRLVSLGRYEEALPLFEAVVEDDPGNWRALGGLALTRGRLGQGEKAIEEFEEAIFLNYESYENHLNFATLLMDLGMTGRAQTELSVALEQGARDPVVHYSVAVAMRTLGRRERALEAVGRAIELDPADPSFWNLRAVLLTETDPAEALDAFREAERLGLGGPSFWNNYGILLSRLARWKEAEVLFARAHEASPDMRIAAVNLAKARLALGRAKEAHALLAGLEPGADDTVRLLLGRAALETGRLEEARVALEGIAEPSDESWNLLALVRRAAGDPEGAVEAGRAAIELSPGTVSYWVNLGVFLAETGRVDDALEAWGRALELDPENETARANRAAYSRGGSRP